MIGTNFNPVAQLDNILNTKINQLSNQNITNQQNTNGKNAI